ncbi:MAG: lipoyl(octanoyl) transferase LipB, partial [Gammaproteobacteria bacterium]
MQPRVRDLGLTEYTAAWEAMRRFTDRRTEATPDEIWLLEHPPVFTLGLGGK